jgi:hypothetical protein
MCTTDIHNNSSTTKKHSNQLNTIINNQEPAQTLPVLHKFQEDGSQIANSLVRGL